MARELATTLGYTGAGAWQNFERVVKVAKAASQSQGYEVEMIFSDVTKNSPGAGRPSRDYRLTRFACYMIALSADGAKELVAAAKVYFAVMTREREELRTLMNAIGDHPLAEIAQRILRRQELTEAHKKLFARARDAGVITPEQYARFMNWGYKGLYAGESATEIHARKGIPARAEISDWMGAMETMANIMRSMLTHRMMGQRGIATARDANQTHYQAGQRVREWYALMGMSPEELPTPSKSYQQIVKEEAARIAREEENARGLWGQLSTDSDSSPPKK